MSLSDLKKFLKRAGYVGEAIGLLNIVHKWVWRDEIMVSEQIAHNQRLEEIIRHSTAPLTQSIVIEGLYHHINTNALLQRLEEERSRIFKALNNPELSQKQRDYRQDEFGEGLDYLDKLISSLRDSTSVFNNKKLDYCRLCAAETTNQENPGLKRDPNTIAQHISQACLQKHEAENRACDQSKNPGIWSGDNPLTDAGPVQLIHEAPAKGVPEVAQAWMSLVQPGGHASAAMATQQLVAQTGLIEAAQTGLLEYEKAGKTAAQVVRDAIQEGMQQAENAIVRFATTGKLEFNSFAQSVITDLIRIQVRQNIIGPLGQYAVSFLSGLFNAGGYNFNSAGTMWGNKPVHPNLGAPNSGAPYLIKHRGGVVGAETSVAHRMVRDVAFDYARRPVYGGLASNEVPAILQRGEMVIPRDLVQASQQLPQVEIHFENRGTPQREVGRTVQFDGQRAIVSVILDDMDRNGPIAQTMQRNFALNPAVS